MSQKKIDDIRDQVKDFPKSPGVYLMKNLGGKVIYVGKAKSLRARVSSYFTNSKGHSVKTLHLVKQIDHVDYLLTKTEVEAFLLEASLIKKYRPRYNIRLKDDRAYPYIKCTMQQDFPRFYLARRVVRDGSIYFGPYTSGLAVRDSIRFLNRTFKIRDCSDAYMKNRKRPCMTYQIGRCTAPCVNYVTSQEYKDDVADSLEFLRGHDKKVVKQLERRMKTAAKEERFEAAAKLRDSIEAVKAIWEKQSVVSTALDKDQDVIAFFGDTSGTLIETVHIRAGRMIGNRPHFIPRLNVASQDEDPKEWMTSFLNQYYSDNIIPDEIILPVDLGSDIRKLLTAVFRERQGKEPLLVHAHDEGELKLMEIAQANAESHFKDHTTKRDNRLVALEEIQSKLKLPELPQRIECYDISNFQGLESVGSQVVFEEGLPKKEDYRRYKIRTVTGSNDFASMKEVLSRRFKHTEYDDPQLVVIDGGKGQLKMALQALKDIGREDVPVVGLAKARTQGEFSDSDVASSRERFFLPGRQNPVMFSNHSSGLQILVSLRDEAHRFAITYHRKLRDEVSFESELDLVAGLGEKRKKTLLQYFSSVDAIKSATASDLAELPGFNESLAKKVLSQIQKISS
ncbi:MAG: excinuclease ABC subunit UvrC [Pseudobdellovibrionaceae bacterium]|nr:excinuclease ABC subunit UvrC [Bdellovibrionales bacterium]USN48634.1 MAG: excinuclease ABC subunit UvrC [Pseudobdellovibrionaceae bacterium]